MATSTSEKDPERVRLGRLGALTVHARGRTNVGPARAAWEAKLIAEVDPDGSLAPAERDRRFQYALRLRMTRLAMTRWGRKQPSHSPHLRAVDRAVAGSLLGPLPVDATVELGASAGSESPPNRPPRPPESSPQT